MRYFKANPTVWDKGGDAGPVTQADLEIDAMLSKHLKGARPNYGWLSEETDDDPARLQDDTVFIIDPIDGTRSFIQGHENFAVALAVAHKGEVRDAVVHMPAKNITYSASLGAGSFKNGERLSSAKTPALKGARILTAGATLTSPDWKHRPQIERHFRASLAYRFCLVAEARFDGMMTLRDTWEWDSAAGALIATEAGAKVTQKTGEPALYNSVEAKHKGFFVGSTGVVDDLIYHLNG